MGKLELPYLNSFIDRHGRERFYFRYKGKRRPINGRPGSPEFGESYQEAAGELLPPDGAPKPKRPPEGTLAHVIEAFINSLEFAGTTASTQLVYRRRLDWLREHYGEADLDTLTEDAVRDIRNQLAAHPTVANRIIYFLGRLWRFSKEDLRMKLGPDPTREVRKVRHKGTSHPVWPLELCAKFEALPRPKLVLAYYLMRYTGQRRSDIVKMKWSQFDGSAVEVVQQKTGTYCWIPCHRTLREYLATVPRTGPYILMSDRGDLFAATSITNMVCTTAKALGFPGYSPHGLRHLAGAALAESGCSMHEIMSILGHVTEKEAADYVRQANRKVMARSAVDKWEATGLPLPETPE